MADEVESLGDGAGDSAGGGAPALVRYVALYRMPGLASRGFGGTGRVEFDLPSGTAPRDAWAAARQRIKDSGWINPPPVIAVRMVVDGVEQHVAGLKMA